MKRGVLLGLRFGGSLLKGKGGMKKKRVGRRWRMGMGRRARTRRMAVGEKVLISDFVKRCLLEVTRL